jgi:hypothetical protein
MDKVRQLANVLTGEEEAGKMQGNALFAKEQLTHQWLF